MKNRATILKQGFKLMDTDFSFDAIQEQDHHKGQCSSCRYEPIVIFWRDLVGIAWQTPAGWSSKIVDASIFEEISNSKSCPEGKYHCKFDLRSTRDYVEQSLRHQLGQLTWKKKDGIV